MLILKLHKSHLDYGSTAIDGERKQHPGAIGLIGSAEFVPEVESWWDVLRWRDRGQVGHHSHPSIS